MAFPSAYPLSPVQTDCTRSDPSEINDTSYTAEPEVNSDERIARVIEIEANHVISEEFANDLLNRPTRITYRVRFSGRDFKVSYHSGLRRLLAFSCAGKERLREVREIFETKLNEYQVRENHQFKLENNRTHHTNVMRLDAVAEGINSTAPLCIFDVDDVLVGFPSPSDTRALEEAETFKNVTRKIRLKAPGAKIIIITSGCMTRKKLQGAGIDHQGIEILESRPYEDSGCKSESDYKRYRIRNCDKGRVLTRFLKNKGSRFDAIHFIDDADENLKRVAGVAAAMRLPCHTYNYLRGVKQRNRRWAQDYDLNEAPDMDRFYRENPRLEHHSNNYDRLERRQSTPGTRGVFRLSVT